MSPVVTAGSSISAAGSRGSRRPVALVIDDLTVGRGAEATVTVVGVQRHEQLAAARNTDGDTHGQVAGGAAWHRGGSEHRPCAGVDDDDETGPGGQPHLGDLNRLPVSALVLGLQVGGAVTHVGGDWSRATSGVPDGRDP